MHYITNSLNQYIMHVPIIEDIMNMEYNKICGIKLRKRDRVFRHLSINTFNV